MIQIHRRAHLRGALLLAAASLLAGLPMRASLAAQGLLLYSGQHAQIATALADAFTKQSGIAVEIRKGGSQELADQITEEGEQSPADVFYAESTPSLMALDAKGLLAPLDADTLKQLPSRYAAQDGGWIATSARCRVLVYNKSKIRAGELPASILDVARPEWKDRVGFVPGSGAFQAQILAIEKLKGRPAALAWLRGLKENGRSYPGNMALMRAVESGEVSVGLVNHYYWFVLAQDVGATRMQSGLHYLPAHDPGTLVTLSGAAVLKGAPHPSAAQKFVAFLVSEEGQKTLAQAVAEYPLRPGVKSPYDVRPLDTIEAAHVTAADLIDVSEAAALRQEAGLP